MNLTPKDAALLKLLAGAHFHSGAKLTLPSGAVLDENEANALTAAYLPDSGLPDRTVPPELAGEPWRGAVSDVAGWWAANDRLEAEVKTLKASLTDAEAYGRQMWIVALFFVALDALFAVPLLLCALLSGAA